MMNKKKVLVVDDEISFRETLADIFEMSGYSVSTASSGIEALDIMKYDLPDLIISDIKMPEMNGFSLLEKTKKDHPDIPVMLMSAYYRKDDNPTKHQPTCFIDKPMDMEKVVMKVDYALSWGNL